MQMITKGATSQTVYVEVLDSTSTTGGRKTGLAYNTASLTAYYVRSGGSATAITLATLAAANSAWSSGGFKEVDSTNMPGIYRLDLPDAAVASGADSVLVTLKGATGMVQVSLLIPLIAANLQDSVRAGLTALPNAAAEASGGLYTRGSGAGQIKQPANGQIDANVVKVEGTDATDYFATLDDATLAAIAALNNLSQANIRTALGMSSANLDTQLDALPTAAEILAAILAGTYEGSETIQGFLRLAAAALFGKASGLATTTAIYYGADGTTARVTATVDADGNRSAVTRNA